MFSAHQFCHILLIAASAIHEAAELTNKHIVISLTTIGATIALEAVKIAGSTKGSDIKKALPKVRYNGITGLIEFNETGDAKRDVAYVKHANNKTGQWEFVAIQSVK